MDFIILESVEENTFIEREISSFQMKVICNFLRYTVGMFAEDVKNELRLRGEYIGNVEFAKKLNGLIIIGHAFNDSWTFTLPEKQFVELLDKWDTLLKIPVLPKKAIITMDDNYNFEIKYEIDGVEKII